MRLDSLFLLHIYWNSLKPTHKQLKYINKIDFSRANRDKSGYGDGDGYGDGSGYG